MTGIDIRPNQQLTNITTMSRHIKIWSLRFGFTYIKCSSIVYDARKMKTLHIQLMQSKIIFCLIRSREINLMFV